MDNMTQEEIYAYNSGMVRASKMICDMMNQIVDRPMGAEKPCVVKTLSDLVCAVIAARK